MIKEEKKFSKLKKKLRIWRNLLNFLKKNKFTNMILKLVK